jgi:NAD-dependent DNA ligase
VLDLNGKITREFNNHVTHLVCEKVWSDKFNAARKLNIPIVLPKFIEFSHENNEINNDLIVKELQGLTISTTGFNGEELKEIIDLIKRMNGNYEANMTKHFDLLIVAKDTISQKTKAAEAWKIRMEPKEFLISKSIYNYRS